MKGVLSTGPSPSNFMVRFNLEAIARLATFLLTRYSSLGKEIISHNHPNRKCIVGFVDTIPDYIVCL